MKRVFSRFEEVAEVWAARTQQDGRSGNGSFFFDGDVIYSYRRSFPVAAMFDAPDGCRFVLVVDDTPSTSTAAVRSVAAAAARHIGCVEIRLPTIAPIVETFSRTKREVGPHTLTELRKALEAHIGAASAEADRHDSNSWAQSSRLSTVSTLLRVHADIAAAFDLNWPALASPEAYRARAEMAHEVSKTAGEAKNRAEKKARKERERRVAWETAHPLPPAQELAQWRTGARLTLQNQQEAEVPRWGAVQALRARLVDGHFSTNHWWSRPAKDFSRIFRAAVAVAADQPGASSSLWIGGNRLEIHGNGDVFLNRDHFIPFDELMTCAELAAPRLHAKAVAMMAEADDDEDEYEAPAAPAGLAP